MENNMINTVSSMNDLHMIEYCYRRIFAMPLYGETDDDVPEIILDEIKKSDNASKINENLMDLLCKRMDEITNKHSIKYRVDDPGMAFAACNYDKDDLFTSYEKMIDRKKDDFPMSTTFWVTKEDAINYAYKIWKRGRCGKPEIVMIEDDKVSKKHIYWIEGVYEIEDGALKVFNQTSSEIEHYISMSLGNGPKR